jgi:predicted phosphodiesterase
MKLLLLSDLHLEFADLALPDTLDFDVAVLAGDIVCPGSAVVDWVKVSAALGRAKAVVMVNGNHEYYDSVLQHEAQAMMDAARQFEPLPLHLLDCGAQIIDGVRFVGCTLWTDFELHIDTPTGPVSDRDRGLGAAARAMADYRTIRWDDGDGAERRLTPHDTLRLHRLQRDWLGRALAEPFDGPTVVVTHHGPHRGSLVPRFAADWVSAAYISELPERFFEVPALWVHGHTHSSRDYRVGGCRVICNPRGYQWAGMTRPENHGFDPGLVVEV